MRTSEVSAGAAWLENHALMLAARGRNEAVHPQVFHHLTVVVEGMPLEGSRQPQSSNWCLFCEGILHGGDQIAFIDGSYCFMSIGYRIFQKF
jgi:hypothetical protein